MIPTLLFWGLVVGRWWMIPLAAVVWPVLVRDVCTTLDCRLGASALGAVNVALAVGIHQLVRLAWRRARERTRRRPQEAAPLP